MDNIISISRATGMAGNASRQQGARKVWMGGSEAQNLRLDCAPLNILSRVHFKVLNTPQCTGNNIIRTELYMRSFATCNTAYSSPWKRSVGWLQHGAGKSSCSIELTLTLRAPENQSARSCGNTIFSLSISLHDKGLFNFLGDNWLQNNNGFA